MSLFLPLTSQCTLLLPVQEAYCSLPFFYFYGIVRAKRCLPLFGSLCTLTHLACTVMPPNPILPDRATPPLKLTSLLLHMLLKDRVWKAKMPVCCLRPGHCRSRNFTLSWRLLKIIFKELPVELDNS